MPSKGDITLSKMLDFDTMERSKLFLNLSVSDEPPSSPTAKTTYTTLEIHVADVNDQPPYFEPPYFSFIRLAHIGPLSVTQAIKGKISDTVGTPLVYSIKFGNRQNLFNINPVTGAVNQIRSVNDAGLPDKEFRLIIEVKKDLPSKDLSSIAILTVKVYERISDTDGCIIPPAENSTEVKGFKLTLFLIALGILSCSRSIFI
ncbi:protocadherin Fat 2-like isoform X1 [Ruditapes philippinarum]|uniref:protocadherin Fat 2-like isoform X1 n=1 Tax=Ruditapes philippinarum TaxID=129788 RepID=UPI00295BC53A|nr:protocadherin Fat 2-like isoform X1 [Ruditapes philippinarum]